MRFQSIVLGALLAFAAPALASDASATSTSSAAMEAPAAKPKKLCRAGESNSAGRIGSGRVCKTAEEWAKVDAEKKSGGRSVRSIKAD